MRNYLFILLASALLFGACKKEEPISKNTSMTLTGDWYMTDYMAFTPQPIVLTYGDIIWSFDAVNQTITIQNSTNNLQPSGTYTYTNTATQLTIAFTGYSQTFDCSFANGKMTLSDNPELDGPVLVFSR
ncbi:MAG: hypothetical protein ACRBFS_21505 [Aureispira sp.]